LFLAAGHLAEQPSVVPTQLFDGAAPFVCEDVRCLMHPRITQADGRPQRTRLSKLTLKQPQQAL